MVCAFWWTRARPVKMALLHCTHSARWQPSFDDTTAYTAPPIWVDGRFAALPSVRGGQNDSVGLCLLPKAASSRVKKYVFAALKSQGVAVGPDWRDCPHRQPLPPVAAPPSTGYLIFRHPLLRLASAWREITRRRLWHRLPHRVATPNATFAVALRAIMATRDWMTINIHLRPALFQCGLLHGRRYRILHYEDWEGLTSVLAAHFAPTLPRLQYRASGTLARAHGLYSKDLATKANKFFEGDLLIGQYEPWYAGQNVTFGPSHPQLRSALAPSSSTRTSGSGAAARTGHSPYR